MRFLDTMNSVLTRDSATRIRKKFPMTDQHIAKLRDLFDAYDKDKDGSLGLNELVILLEELGNKITALPAVSDIWGTNILHLTLPADCPSRLPTGQVPRCKVYQNCQATTNHGCQRCDGR